MAACLSLLSLLWSVRRLRYGVVRVKVVGWSMEPTLAPGSEVIARRVPPHSLSNGDIVVLLAPDSGQLIIKRIAAIGGTPNPAAEGAAGDVPDGMVVLLGDNLDKSHDSRHFGCVPANQIMGRVIRQLR
ncbi:S26 family signal peptidase [Streptomyces eurythermus]|uniref:S26 family signal peptidase n=1 Tax=Streptomyces eurythermus TaxID=42237 RepID=UPI0036FD9822